MATIPIKHTFQSAKADGLDSSFVQPSNWNAEHTLVMATAKLVGRATAGSGGAEEITPSATHFEFASSTLQLKATFTATLALWAGGTFTGNVIMDLPSTSGVFTITGATNGVGALVNLTANNTKRRALVGRTGANARWGVVLGDTVNEGTGNTGAHFAVERYDDNGNLLDKSISILRDTGVVDFPIRPTFGGAPLATVSQLPLPGLMTLEYISAEQTLAVNTLTTLNHGLSALPKTIIVELVCKTTEAGWAVGDRVQMPTNAVSNASSVHKIWFVVGYNGTQVFVRTPYEDGVAIPSKDGSSPYTLITLANWRLVVRAYA